MSFFSIDFIISFHTLPPIRRIGEGLWEKLAMGSPIHAKNVLHLPDQLRRVWCHHINGRQERTLIRRTHWEGGAIILEALRGDSCSHPESWLAQGAKPEEGTGWLPWVHWENTHRKRTPATATYPQLRSLEAESQSPHWRTGAYMWAHISGSRRTDFHNPKDPSCPPARAMPLWG